MDAKSVQRLITDLEWGEVEVVRIALQLLDINDITIEKSPAKDKWDMIIQFWGFPLGNTEVVNRKTREEYEEALIETSVALTTAHREQSKIVNALLKHYEQIEMNIHDEHGSPGELLSNKKLLDSIIEEGGIKNV